MQAQRDETGAVQLRFDLHHLTKVGFGHLGRHKGGPPTKFIIPSIYEFWGGGVA